MYDIVFVPLNICTELEILPINLGFILYSSKFHSLFLWALFSFPSLFLHANFITTQFSSGKVAIYSVLECSCLAHWPKEADEKKLQMSMSWAQFFMKTFIREIIMSPFWYCTYSTVMHSTFSSLSFEKLADHFTTWTKLTLATSHYRLIQVPNLTVTIYANCWPVS